MASAKDLTYSIIQRIFSNWTALRMAVEHGMGSKDRAVEFCRYITDVMSMNVNLSSDDLAAELEEYMDEKFQTELQDNSQMEIAEVLIKFNHCCHAANFELATAEMNKLRQLQSWILSRDELKQTSSQQINDSSSDDDDGDDDADNKNSVNLEDEWQVITRKRKT